MTSAEPGPADAGKKPPPAGPAAARDLATVGNGLGGLDGMVFGGWKTLSAVVLILGLLSAGVFLGPKYAARTEQLARQRDGRMHTLRQGQGTAAASSAGPRGEIPSGPLPLILLTGMLGLFAATAWIWWRTAPPVDAAHEEDLPEAPTPPSAEPAPKEPPESSEEPRG